MAWIAVDKDGSEWIYSEEPLRDNRFKREVFMTVGHNVPLPKGSILKLTGKVLDWSDEPLEIK